MKKNKEGKLIKFLFLLFALVCSYPAIHSQEVVYDETECRYTSYDGLVMCGYQGWFTTPEDPLSSGWFHYSRAGEVKPGYISIDCWPDMTEYEKKLERIG